ncbi:MAG: PQQ-binding-like beta-propeller repeat protein [Pseudomonadota bacterium]
MPRVPLICAILALPWLAAAHVALAAPQSSAPAAGPRALPTRFRFDAGAPLLAPAGVAADGTVCVGTVDGYIHALAPDGSYRWSYSLHGAITHRPLFVGALWYVATSAGRIEAFTRDGALAWAFNAPSPVASELATDASGLLYFVAADHFLYGITAHGGVSLRTPFAEAKAGPSGSAGEAVFPLNHAGIAVGAQGQGLRRFGLATAPAFDFGALDTLRDPAGHLWRVVGGALAFSASQAAAPDVFTLGGSPLLAPVWSSVGNYAVLSARSGLIVAVDPPPTRQAR